MTTTSPSKLIRIPYSVDQWNALVDSQIYGFGYGLQIGELDYVKAEMVKRGYPDPEMWSYYDMDDVNSEHVVTLK